MEGRNLSDECWEASRGVGRRGNTHLLLPLPAIITAILRRDANHDEPLIR